MRGKLRGPLTLSVIAAGVLALVHLAGAISLTSSLRIGAVAVSLPLLVSSLRRLATAFPAPNETGASRVGPALFGRLGAWATGHRTRPTPDDGEEHAIAHLVRFGEISAMDFHIRLRPRLAAVLGRRLASAGIDPTDLASVSRSLGPLAASLLDPTLAPPRERDARGVAAADVALLLERAEELT